MGKNHSLLSKSLILLISSYRLLLSPLLGNQCRFYPSCSCYAQQAIAAYGALRGCWLTAKRLLCCQPFHPGGYDPINTPPSDSP